MVQEDLERSYTLKCVVLSNEAPLLQIMLMQEDATCSS